MIVKWMKSKTPRSLLGRAMMILVVPVVVIQIVVAYSFAERLYRDVSDQMSRNVALEISYLADIIDTAPDKLAAISHIQKPSKALNIFVSFDNSLIGKQDRWVWYDLSGGFVVNALRQSITNVAYVDLTQNRKLVNLTLSTNKGAVSFQFSRSRASARNPHQLLVLMVLTAFVFTTIAVLFLNNQIKPIRRLSEAAEAFGRGWSIPFNPRGAREVRSAGHAFLAMRTRIIRQIEQRTMMLSGVSHDLRTPLTRMKLSLGLLEPSEEVDYLGRDVDEMEAMLTEFLEFARGDSEEQTELVGIKALAKRLAHNFKRANMPIELRFIGDVTQNTTFKCRERAVQRALENLLRNAGRYGDTQRLSVTIEPDQVVFCVEDDGPGIPKDQRDMALEPFSRLDSARNQNDGSGSGLGLAIAADIARSHGGELTLLHSDDLGGLKATLTIPN